MKILVVIPDPLDDEWVPVMATEEWQTIAIAFAQKGISVTLFNLYPPTWNNLRQTLSGTWSPFDVVHFIGHGNSDGIVLEDEWGEQDFILTEDLSLALVQSDIRLIVLNVCESELPAEALVAAGLSTVIGTTESIDDGQALILAHELYATLATGQTIEKAMVGVRAALHHSGDDEDIPIVIGRVDTRFATASDTHAIPRSKILNKPRNNLQYSGSFFGRRAELAKGLQLLGDAQCRGIEITGIGGTGKTAYTLELANRGSWRFYGGILWLDGVSHFSSLEQILLNKVNSVLIGDNEQAIDSLDDAVKLLNSQAILMVFDNADKLSQSVMTQLQAFTKRLNPLIGSMIILTSRIPTMFSDEIGDIASLPLSGLDVTSTLEFVRHRARLQNINEIFALSDYELKELMVQLGGNPKLIQMLLGLIGSTGLEKSRETLKQLSGPIPDALESLVGELVTTLNEADLDVLLASTLFVSPFHIDDIMTVVSFDNSQDSLITLTKRGLLDRYSFSSLCTIHPLVGDYIATKYPVREHMILQHATFVADQMRKLTSTASHLRDRAPRDVRQRADRC